RSAPAHAVHLGGRYELPDGNGRRWNSALVRKRGRAQQGALYLRSPTGSRRTAGVRGNGEAVCDLGRSGRALDVRLRPVVPIELPRAARPHAGRGCWRFRLPRTLLRPRGQSYAGLRVLSDCSRTRSRSRAEYAEIRYPISAISAHFCGPRTRYEYL